MMAVKVFSLPFLIGFAGICLIFGLFSEAKAAIDIKERATLNQTQIEQEMVKMKAYNKQSKRQRGRNSQRNKCTDRWYCPYLLSGYNGFSYCQIDWVRKDCPRSCNSCPCTDEFGSDCVYYAYYGLCTYHESWVKDFVIKNCKKSCNICSSCKCGQANSGSRNRIVGGDPTDPNEFPWQVALKIKIGDEFSLCGGSIISNKEILTAAHCVWNKDTNTRLPKESITVLVGQHDLSKGSDENTFKLCEEPTVHNSYNSRTLDYDFAILSLCGELKFKKAVSPVCLPKWDDRNFNYDHNEGLDNIISGWGLLSDNGNFPNKLQKITVQTISNAACTPQVNQLHDITERMLCGQAADKNICGGDSGGPWVTKYHTRNYFLTGVTSWGPYGVNGEDHCVRGMPAVAARVTNQLAWIQNNMRGETCPPDPRPLQGQLYG